MGELLLYVSRRRQGNQIKKDQTDTNSEGPITVPSIEEVGRSSNSALQKAKLGYLEKVNTNEQ